MRRAALALAVVAGCLAGCGVKGALYLPEKPGEVIIRPAPGTEPTAGQPESPPADVPETPRD